MAVAPSVHEQDAATHLPEWTSAEREDFFNAIARHRRAAWQVTLASHGANFIVALIVALLMAPLFYAAAALALDVLNLFRPAPNLVGVIGAYIGPLMDAPAAVPLQRWLTVGAFAALPGLSWMAVVLTSLRRALRVSATFDSGELSAREPNRTVLSEQRLANVIGEMAIAANLPAPRVLITDASIRNAAVFGRDDAHATIVVSSLLLDALNRDEMQGVAGHLIGSIANGDVRIGLQAATTLSLFGLISRLSTAVTDRSAWRPLGRIALALLRPTRASAQRLADELADPFAPEPTERPAPTPAQSKKEQWRALLWLPLAGPVVMTGFFAALVTMFGLGPLMALVWRRRKYLADATAVRLTRDPDTLASALEKLGNGGSFATWATHLAVAGARAGSRGLMSGSIVPMAPALPRRLRALAKLGARLRGEPARMPTYIVLLAVPLFAVIGSLVALACFLLAYVSIPLTALFTGIPFAILHLLLRWIGGAPPS